MVPPAFVMMTRRRKVDYVAVLEHLKGLVARVEVVEMQSDFEPAIWSAVKEVFPRVVHRGCNFHWSQALIRKVKIKIVKKFILFLYIYIY